MGRHDIPMRSIDEIRADLGFADRDGRPWPSAAQRLLEDLEPALDLIERQEARLADARQAKLDILAACAGLMWATDGSWASVVRQVQELARRLDQANSAAASSPSAAS